MDNGASSYRRFLDGDESAFNEIMEELFRSLVFFINGYVHDIHAAEDIAIDAFSDLVVHRHRYNFKVTLKTYVFMLGRSRALDYICYTLQSSFENSGGDNKESVNDMEDDGLVEDNKDFSQSGTTNLSSEFRIIFTTENGSQTIYSLSGYKLINETTKQETLLTADQRSNILDTLGLTITWEEEPK